MEFSLKAPCQERREDLLKAISQKHNLQRDDFVVLLVGDLEDHVHSFLQDSTFYYYSSVVEPGVALTLSAQTKLWVPSFKTSRRQWVEEEILPSADEALKYEVDEVCALGEAVAGYSLSINSNNSCYQYLVDYLKTFAGKSVFIPLELMSATQRVILGKIQSLIGGSLNLIDCSSIIKSMRMTKSSYEIDRLFRAIEVTNNTHGAVARAVKPGVYEKEIAAVVEYVFTSSGATAAFPTIVGSGYNGTILHYNSGKSELKAGDLVVVDCGARYDYYCADITRTYPVSGKFTKRQEELYNIVLDVQRLVAEHAKPGVWLNNAQDPANSLQHIALEYLKSKSLDKYFVHGIGHHLGLDVHDVCEKRPLAAHDVITIEPGVYIPEENIGIRIEDNYWIMPDGAICLSESIPKDIDQIIDAMSSQQVEDESDFTEID